MKLFAAIQKRDEEQRMVWGYASTEALDAQGEVVKLDAIKGAWEDYMKFANIREMHQPSAVGKCKEYEFDDKGVMIGVKVVDDNAWQKVVEGVYSGFSIGGKALNKSDGVIHQLRLTEISLVDRPANPEAMITVFKGEDIPAQADLGLEQSNTEKGLWTAARMAEALAALEGVQLSMSYEEGAEGEGPALPDELKGKVVDLIDLLARYVGKQGEEIAAGTAKADLEADLAKAVSALEANGFTLTDGAWAAPVEKAGARYSKATKAALADVHGMLKKCNDTMDKMGYADAEESDDEKADKVADLQKSVDTQAGQLDAIAKALTVAEGEDIVAKAAGLADELAKSQARVAELEAEPAKPTVNVTGKVIEKSEDGVGAESGTPMAEVEKKLEAGEAVSPAELLKAIHANGGRQLV